MSSNNVRLNLNPETKTFDTGNLTTTVKTNNDSGYLLVLTANDTKLTEQSDNTLTIPTLAENPAGYTESTFTPNAWGYKFNTENYFPFITYTKISSSPAPTNGDTTTLTFAAKADYAATPGNYSLDLDFQVMANIDIPLIQNLNASLCTTESPTIVMDSRDGEYYLVQRLKDGKCWMLNDLRLGSTTESITLTKEDTNMSAATWELPKSGSNCFNTSSCTGTNGKSGTGLTVPAIDASDKGARFTHYGKYNFNIGTVLYNYCAATAGTFCSSNNNSSSPSYSICPAGWRLPTGSNSSGAKGETYNLCTAYKGSACSNALNTQTNMTPDAASAHYALNIQLAGKISYNNRNVKESGADYWTTTNDIRGGTTAAAFYFTTTGVYAFPSNYRHNGNSIRCVLK